MLVRVENQTIIGKKMNQGDICDYRHWGEPIWREESRLNLRDYPNLWQKCYRRK